MNRFEQALRQRRTLLLDGGLATELEAREHDLGTALWSARLLRDDPEAIVGVHLAYLEAGAQCIISASYQASRGGLMALGCSARKADGLIERAVELAQAARDRYLEGRGDCKTPPLVAASVGPWGAAAHDGSEYTGSYAADADTLAAFHGERLPLLDRAGADVLACETVPNLDEARILGDLLRDASTPAWVSFCCRDDRHLSDGTPIEEAAAMFDGHPRVLAVGVNCTAPRFVAPLIARLRASAPAKAIVVYPNSGERFDIGGGRWRGGSDTWDAGQDARAWRAAGALLIGGCCRVGPGQIAEMRRALDDGA